MSFSTRIKGLEVRIKRLEAAAGKGQRCAMCRLTLRKSWPDPNKPKSRPEDLVQAKCEFCHSDYTASLTNIEVELREAFRLHYSFTLEDQYTNPKAHALHLWLKIRSDGQKRRKHGTTTKAKINNKGASALAKLWEDTSMCSGALGLLAPVCTTRYTALRS